MFNIKLFKYQIAAIKGIASYKNTVHIMQNYYFIYLELNII